MMLNMIWIRCFLLGLAGETMLLYVVPCGIHVCFQTSFVSDAVLDYEETECLAAALILDVRG